MANVVDKAKNDFPHIEFIQGNVLEKTSVRNSFDTLKQEGMSPSISDVDTIHNQIDDILNRAKALAELELPDLMEEIRIEGATRAAQRQAARSGNIQSAQQFIDSVQNK